MNNKIIYFSGPPGSGKSFLTDEFKKLGIFTFGELIDPFPSNIFTDPTSFETAKYVFDQNVKRDKLIKQYLSNLVIVDRHPMDNVLVARGLMKDNNTFNKIEKLYMEYQWEKGIIVLVRANKRVVRNRTNIRNHNLITTNMHNDIYSAFTDYYQDYLIPNYVLDGSLNVKEQLKIILGF